MRPEMEIFDTGHLWFARAARRRGPDRRRRRCSSSAWASPTARRPTRASSRRWSHQLPEGAVWASFAIGRDADALGGAVGPAGRPRARRARGQPLPRARACGHQRRSWSSGAARSSRRWAPRSRRPDEAREILRLQAASLRCDRSRGRPHRRLCRCRRHRRGLGRLVPGARLRVARLGPGPRRRARLAHLVDAAWPALTELGLAEGGDRGRLTVAPDLARACAQADLVQESAPERLALKRRCSRRSTPRRRPTW